MEDPFHPAHRDLLNLLESTRPLLSSYLRIRSTSPSADSPELSEARKELENALTDVSTDLQDLIDSVKAVEHDPYRFGLDVAEVQRRRELVSGIGKEVEDMRRQVLATAQSSLRSGAASTTGGLPDPRAFDVAGDEDDPMDDDAYRQFEEQRQQELLHEQDEALDGVFRTVGNLRQQADEMGRELEEQGELIDSVDNLADRVGGKLQSGLKRVAWIARKNEDTYSSCCIAALIVVLIILLVLVLII